jgi:uncharacterized membrane protein YccC
MPTSGYSLRQHLLESLTGTRRPDVPLQVVLRNTAAVVLPLGIGLALGHPQIGLGVGAGALNTMFSDQPGPYRQRLLQLLLAALAAGLASFTGLLIGGDLPPMLVATAAFGFFGGLLVVFGVDIARVGMTSMILLVVTASTPTSLTGALQGTALIISGGLLLTLFSLAAWPWQRYLPERHALADVYTGLAALARQRTHDDADVPALTDAMTNLQHTLLGRHRAHGRAMEAFGVLLELAERIRLELTAMAELQADTTGPVMFRDDAAQVLTAIADALRQGASPEHASHALLTLQANERVLSDSNQNIGANVLTAHVHALSGQLAAAVRNADWAGSAGELRASAAEARLPKALRSGSAWATLRASLTPRSMAFRHALRMAVSFSFALLLSRKLQLPHGYWLPMTAAIVLRPDFAATFNFGLLRVVGTVLGLLLTTALLHLAPNVPWAHLLLMAALCMAFRYLATAHYGIAVAALTGTVVILLSFEGVDPGAAVVDRVINTVLGCGMALLAYVVWPTWERNRAHVALSLMLDAYAAYLHALAQPAARQAHRDMRSAARTARTNAQASIERMRAEPGTPPTLLALARALFANGNRLARTAMTLEATLDDLASLPAHDSISPFVEQTSRAVHAIASALSQQRAVEASAMPDLRMLQRRLVAPMHGIDAPVSTNLLTRISDRLVDNVNTLAHVVNRSVSTPGLAGEQASTPG